MVGSGSSQSPSVPSRCGLPATAREERPSGRGCARRRPDAASFICRGRDIAAMAEWNVPPENIPLARTTPRTVTGPAASSC